MSLCSECFSGKQKCFTQLGKVTRYLGINILVGWEVSDSKDAFLLPQQVSWTDPIPNFLSLPELPIFWLPASPSNFNFPDTQGRLWVSATGGNNNNKTPAIADISTKNLNLFFLQNENFIYIKWANCVICAEKLKELHWTLNATHIPVSVKEAKKRGLEENLTNRPSIILPVHWYFTSF